jgi:ATP-dependent RNA helicase DDX55/SPB4
LVAVKEKGKKEITKNKLVRKEPFYDCLNYFLGEDDLKKATPTSLENHYMMCKASDKFSHLVKFLRDHNEKTILFLSTCACVEFFALILERILKETRPVFALHSKKAKRGNVFESFKTSQNGKKFLFIKLYLGETFRPGKNVFCPLGLLVCTDVMARGIDVPDVRWVLQFDPPTNTEAFVHRCGRTARIGHQGSAILFLMPSEDAYIEFIKLNQNVMYFHY